MSEPPPPPTRKHAKSWLVEALTISLDARPKELNPTMVDSSVCGGCRRDISREVGYFCPHCGLKRPERFNLNTADFVPLCSDCGYDLSGLADGRCPECNRYFELDRLKLAWAVKRGSATSKYDIARGVYIAVLIGCLLCSCIVGHYPAFTIVLAVSIIMPIIHYKVCPNIAVAGGHILLLALPPILICALQISFDDYPRPGQFACLVAAISLCLLALWASPLRSALVIATAISLPMLIIGGLYLLDGVVAYSAGSPWATIEAPIGARWGVPRAEESILGGGIICGSGLMLSALAGAFSRRILLQLRSRSNQAPPTVRPVSPLQPEPAPEPGGT